MKEIANLTGGFNLYSRTRGAFNGTPPLLIDLLATRASVAIENAQVYGASKRLIEQLNAAIKSREVIGAAKGILMARESVTEKEAFEMLVRLSQNSNVKLREVAQRIVDQEQDH